MGDIEASGTKSKHAVEIGFADRAELYHRLILEDFNFIEAARSESRQYEKATLSTTQVKTMYELKRTMAKMPQGLVNFSLYGHKFLDEVSKADEVIQDDYRTRRFITRMSRLPPLDVWSKWVLSRDIFQVLVIIVIFLNSLVIIIEGEIDDGSATRSFRQTIDSIDFLFLTIFIVDIVFKFLDVGWGFFDEYWNTFDLVVTIASGLAVMFDLIYQDSNTSFGLILQLVDYLRVFRILRSLNVVTRWKRIRLLWIAVIHTVSSLVFILMLMFLFFFIFALIGIQLFDRFTRSHINNLEYHAAFKNLGSAMLTLFQLFTLDHWYRLILSLERVMEDWIPISYCLLWVLLGSFIFRNIFVSAMVNNFQNIRRELAEETNTKGKSKFAVDLNLLGLDKFASENIESDPLTNYEDNVFHQLEIINSLGDGITPMLIPRDTLLQYFVILEAIARNLDEREHIFKLLNQALLQQYDE